ncbi:methyltransferase, cyclopropane fatty acid synthase [Nostoc sp. PCC 7524]|uniref:class I SAM-dependent methyltransferase n=1 Tax=Nostoc sp. (strain ATCC 29411 / PCC 7524) TaxID=28072 RepID=UPI00029F3591|nr:class I SAM-dependent methyltransferase [Nostoc sp. PCC 7524]AFY47232.1 methyltransferase, cyclopropane fatty acid synthase [Nostoc sp. PCC 7524]
MATQTEIAVSYDVDNDFFRLWLDKRMIYSCAVFEDTDDLEIAQINKLKWHSSAAKAIPDKRLLDIGCGWGGTMEFLSQEIGVKDLTGITLSHAQYSEVKAKSIPGVSVECVSYLDYQPKQKFDGVISIGMFEHIARPEQERTGEHISVYRDYFHRAWQWTNPGSWFALQSIVKWKAPRSRNDIREMSWLPSAIFPGSALPRLEAIIASVNPYWEVMEVKTRREHYARTTSEWLLRLRSHEELITQRWGKERFQEYERYLNTCVMIYDKGYNSLAQIALRRVD